MSVYTIWPSIYTICNLCVSFIIKKENLVNVTRWYCVFSLWWYLFLRLVLSIFKYDFKFWNFKPQCIKYGWDFSVLTLNMLNVYFSISKMQKKNLFGVQTLNKKKIVVSVKSYDWERDSNTFVYKNNNWIT